jgi:chromosome segregation ATPase
MKGTSEMNSRTREVIDIFLAKVCPPLGLPGVAFDSFVNQNGCDLLASAVCDKFSQLDGLARSADNLRVLTKQLESTFGFPPDANPAVLVIQLESLAQDIASKEAEISRLEKYCTRLKHKGVSIKRRLEAASSDFAEERSAFQAEMDRLSSQCRDEAVGRKEQQREVRHLLQEIDESRRLQEKTEAAFRTEQDALLNEKARIESGLRDELTHVKATCQDCLLQLEEKSALIGKLKKHLRVQKAAVADRDIKLEALCQEMAAGSQAQTEQQAVEKGNLQATYEATISHLNEELVTLRSDIQSLNAKLKVSEKVIKQYKKKISEMRSEKERLDQELVIKNGQLARERKLAETAAEAKVLAAESDFTTKLEEAKRKLESEKRRIFAFAADNFSQFFNPQEAIDENSFKAVVVRAKNELGKLANSDVLIRRTVGASPGQDTTDAVAQLASSQL